MSNIERNIRTDFYNRVVNLLKEARKSVIKTVNKTMVYTYFEIGRIIVEEQQQGQKRAAYGKQILKGLSEKLSIEFGKGFSVDNLENMRRFYLSYSISETPSQKLTNDKSETVSRNFNTPDFQLS